MLHVSIDDSGLITEVAQGFVSQGIGHDVALTECGAHAVVANIVAKDFLVNEIRRVGAPSAEIRAAFAIVASASAHDPRAYDALTPRMRRLVDLAIVAGSSVSVVDFEAAAIAIPPRA